MKKKQWAQSFSLIDEKLGAVIILDIMYML